MENQASSSGIGFIGLLQIVFIVLKLIGKIDWSWWWVLAPIWGTSALVFVLVFVAFVWAVLNFGRKPCRPRAR